jgi:predicted NACHT family NTPase
LTNANTRTRASRTADAVAHGYGATPGLASAQSPADLYVEPILASTSGEKLLPAEALGRSRAVVVVGPPGAGKTTLLRRLAWLQASEFFAGRQQRCPVFLQAQTVAQLSQKVGLPSLLADAISGEYRLTLDAQLLHSWIANDLLSVFIDGLDEVVRADDREHFFRSIQASRDAFPSLPLIVSSRPSAISGWLSTFAYFELQSLADASVVEYIRRFVVESPELAEQFIAVLRQNDELRQLAKSPLNLNLLGQIFRAKGTLPTSRPFVYADITDFLLLRWDQVRGIDRRAELPPRLMHLVLQQYALYLFERDIHSINRAEAFSLISRVASYQQADVDPARALSALLDTGLLREVGPEAFGFVHLSFMEYFAAHNGRNQRGRSDCGAFSNQRRTAQHSACIYLQPELPSVADLDDRVPKLVRDRHSRSQLRERGDVHDRWNRRTCAICGSRGALRGVRSGQRYPSKAVEGNGCRKGCNQRKWGGLELR